VVSLEHFITDPNNQDNWGNTILHVMLDRHLDGPAVKELLEVFPVDLEITDMYGKTAIYHLQTSSSEFESKTCSILLQVLLNHDANLNELDGNGKTRLYTLSVDARLNSVRRCCEAGQIRNWQMGIRKTELKSPSNVDALLS
jgi:hypothetical protein